MVLDRQRETIDPILTFFAKPVANVNPDIFTWTALIFAVIAGLFFILSSPVDSDKFGYLLYASVFIFLNGFFDAVDGKIAKLTKKTSKRGDFLDHALDRYADAFIVGGIALSAWCDTRIGIIALVGMFLTSYMGTQAQAVGFKRVYAGLLGRADRLVLLIFIPVIQYGLIQWDVVMIYQFTLIEWTMIYLGVMGNLTALQRFTSTLRYFNKRKKEKKVDEKL